MSSICLWYMYNVSLVSLVMYFVVPQPCYEMDSIRLTNGDTVSIHGNKTGRLEVCSGGQWGSVCNSNGTTNDVATVVCRQLYDTTKGMSNKRFGKFLNYKR